MLNTQLTPDQILSQPIQDGDAGIIIKRDGSFQIFTTGDIANTMSPEAIEQGLTLMGVSIALSTPEILLTLKDMARKTAEVGEDMISLGATN